jgi:hypothetical protein
MKSLKIKQIMTVLTALLFFTSLVYAEPSLELIPGSPNEQNETEVAVRLKNHTEYTELLKASGTAFTLEFSDGVTIAEVTSPFFDTFVNQFNAVENGPEPGSYTVPDGYPAPLVTNDDGITKTMVAAARCTSTSDSNDLMIIKVIATKKGTVTLRPTVLNNPNAGYTEDTKIDVLVGSDSNKGPTDPDAYPVLIGNDMGNIVTNVEPYSGGIVDTDGDGLADSVETNDGNYVDNNHTGTDPNKADTDGDGMNDGDEVAAGRNPLVPEGDANRDGRVNIYDALTIAKLDALLINENDVPGLSVSDVNCDGKVNIYDALKIAKYDALMISNLNCE